MRVLSSKFKFGNSLDFLERKKLEIYWTLLPFLILIVIGVYSLKILYHADVASMYPPRRAKKIKIIGRQWYWRYNYFLKMEIAKRKFRSAILAYDSYMLNLESSNLKSFRKLEVDKPLVMQSWCLYKIITTSSDVIHSFSLPSLGLKLDSVPGRLKEIKTMLLQPGVYYGQCSELCGVNHRFMPIKAESYKFFYRFYANSSPRFRVPKKAR